MEKIRDVNMLKAEIADYFKTTLIKGHKCIFTNKQVTLEDIVENEKQFRLCMICRTCNVLLTLTFIGEGIKKIRKDLSLKEIKEDRPSYIG